MKKFTRRSVLKGITKISGLAAAAPLLPALLGCGPSDRRIALNVVLHGLFVLNITDFNIELLTPAICQHIYRYGGWDIGQVRCLERGGQYALRGVNQEQVLPCIDWDKTPKFCQSQDKFTVKREESYCRVILPFPAGFKLLRCATGESVAPEPYPPAACKPGYIDKDIKSVSLCQVLTYMVPDYRELNLAGSRWKPDIDWQTCTANLHFWAEPPTRLTPQHAEEAYAQLSCLLPPLNLHLRVYSTVPIDRATGINGFPPEQEQGWSDWASGGGEGVHPTNCCAVMVTS